MSKKTRYRRIKECSDAQFIPTPDFTKNRKLRGSQRTGQTFERKVQGVLEDMFQGKVLANSWISYRDCTHGERICSPDILIIDVVAGMVTIVECKLTHTRDAYKQLDWVYKKVVRNLFPGFSVRGIEVCKNFESGTEYPVTPKIVTDLTDNFYGMGNVMVWKD